MLANANEKEEDYSFLAHYEIRYVRCGNTAPPQIDASGGPNEGLLSTHAWVEFTLCETCPTSGSDGCSGSYVMDLPEFVDLYTESKLTGTEHNCEIIRECCLTDPEDMGCDDIDTSGCDDLEGVYYNIQPYLECVDMGDDSNNNDNGGGLFFIGPYCNEDTNSIHLGIFNDNQCQNKAKAELYENIDIGASLPFSQISQPLVTTECTSCLKDDGVENNSNGEPNNSNGEPTTLEPTEFCENAYIMAARCENDYFINAPDKTGCEFISSLYSDSTKTETETNDQP